jgi:hypothetical protein
MDGYPLVIGVHSRSIPAWFINSVRLRFHFSLLIILGLPCLS